MNCLVVLFAVAAIASADVSLGYRYNIPQTSYGVPNYQPSSSGSFNQGSQGASSGSSFHTSSQPQYQNGGNFQSAGAAYQTVGSGSSYQQPSQTYKKYQGTGGNVGFESSGGSLNYQTGSSGVTQSGTGGLNFQSSGLSSSSVAQPTYQSLSNQYVEKSSASKSYQQYYQQAQHQPPQIFKHFYVHQAPEELEVPQFRQPPVLPPPQKHYKVIIIKTPTPPAPAAQFIPLQAQNEEKTIVYVLVKKPEEAGEVVYPKVAPTPPSKPEVVFVKYSGKEGAQGVINNIVSGHGNAGGSGVHVGATIVDGALSDNGASTGELLSGGVSSGGSFSVSEGSSGSSQVGSVHTIGGGGSSLHTVSGGGSGGSYGGNDAGFSGGSLQTVSGGGSDGSYSGSTGDAGFSASSVQTVSSGSSQQQGVHSLGAGQGLPHTSYGIPSFRS